MKLPGSFLLEKERILLCGGLTALHCIKIIVVKYLIEKIVIKSRC